MLCAQEHRKMFDDYLANIGRIWISLSCMYFLNKTSASTPPHLSEHSLTEVPTRSMILIVDFRGHFVRQDNVIPPDDVQAQCCLEEPSSSFQLLAVSFEGK